MTSRRQAGDDAVDGRERVVITTPEDLIASVPAMLGFPPRPGSVVAMCGETASGRPGPTIRLDVAGLQDGDGCAPSEAELRGDGADEGAGGLNAGIDHGPARWLAQYCVGLGVRSVHLVVVAEGCTSGYTAGLRASDAAEAFGYSLGTMGVEVEGAFGVEEFEAGAQWVDLFGLMRGVQQDPGSTHLAAVNAFQGRSGADSREEIEQLYAARDPDASDVESDIGQWDAAQSTGVAMALARHDAAAARLASGDGVDDDELAVIGRSLLEIANRDEVYRQLAMFRHGDGDGHRLLWWAVARRRPPAERSVALVLLGADAYFTGHGVHACCAFTSALEADERNSLARLLLEGLAKGLEPARIRMVAAAA